MNTSAASAPQLPHVTVVVPAYNQAAYLEGALRSVLSQTYTDYEIVVVDDESTDTTPEVVQTLVKACPEAPLSYVWQKNQGLAGARNTGIQHGRGELIALLDSDDEWLPEFLEKMVALADAHPEAVVFYCPVRYIDPDNNDLPQLPPAFGVPPEQLYTRLLRANFLVPSTILMRRAPVEAAGLFDPAFRRLQDWELWLRLLRDGARFIEHPEHLVRYRLHASSLSMDPSGGQQAARALVEKLFGPDDTRWESWPADKRLAYGGCYRYHAVSSVQYRNDWEACGAYLRLALQVDPTLAQDLDLFYELALGAQPIGYRGVQGSNDDAPGTPPEAAQAGLLYALNVAFARPAPPALEAVRGKAFGTAYHALGRLAYNRRELGLSRRHLLRAARYRPELLVQDGVATTLFKSVLGRSTLDRLRRLR